MPQRERPWREERRAELVGVLSQMRSEAAPADAGELLAEMAARPSPEQLAEQLRALDSAAE